LISSLIKVARTLYFCIDITSKPSVKSESSIKVEGNLYDNESKDAYSTMLTIVIDLEIGDFKETTEVEVGTSAGVKL
jgi:hypothetical protein